MRAVLDAVHELFGEGRYDPAAEEVAARSGVSLRSIYRYFPDREQLLVAALSRRLDEADHLYTIERAGEGDVDERVRAYVSRRIELHDAVGPAVRVSLVTSRQVPEVASLVAERRRRLLQLVRDQFAPELDALDPAERERTVTAVGVLCQFESIDSLRHERGLGWAETARVLESGVRALLAQPVAVA